MSNRSIKIPKVINSSIGKPLEYAFKDRKLKQQIIKPKKILILKNGNLLFDFGKVRYGTLKIINHSTNNIIFNIKMLERFHINYDNQLSVGHYTVTLNLKNKQTKILELPKRNLPEKSELPNGITGVIPYRYVIVKKGSLNLTEFSLEQVAISYPFDSYNTKFISSDMSLNKVFELCKHTILATSFANLFVDGNRERLPYEADTYLTTLSQFALNDDYSISERTELYLLNNPTWPIEWSMLSISIAKENYLRSRNKKYLRFIYPFLRERLFLKNISKKGLLKTDELQLKSVKLKTIVDWPPNERPDYATSYIFNLQDELKSLFYKIKLYNYQFLGFKKAAWIEKQNLLAEYVKRHEVAEDNFVTNAFLFDALNNMKFLADQIGKHNDANKFSLKALVLKKALNDYFFDKESGLYEDVSFDKSHESFQTNLFALAFDIVPDSRKEKVLTYIIRNRYKASTYTSFFLLKVLFENNYGALALDYLTSDKTWMYMINNYGATTTMESWNNYIKPNLDYNHPWSATPLYFIIRYIAGIKDNGETILIKPVFTPLKSFNVSMKTKLGMIRYEYKYINNSYEFKIKSGVNKSIKFEFDNPNARIEKINFDKQGKCLQKNEEIICNIPSKKDFYLKVVAKNEQL
ncbi:hypothetical protein FRA_34c06330 [Francisella sp. W12-1067]|nr:hypothetical protein FRA_34c06330 [Francisella sp. W12-1067]